MRIISTTLALALCAVAFAQNSANTPVQQETVPYVKSTYDDCLLTAGPNTWQAMGLNADQVQRLGELQERYKKDGAAYAAAQAKAEADAAKAAKKKSKSKVKEEATVPQENSVQEPSVAITETATSPYDAELRGILTPEQLQAWDHRCDKRMSLQP